MLLIKRYVFELHYQERRQASVPKFLSEVVALLVKVVAGILVLAIGYDIRIPGLLTGSEIAAVILVWQCKICSATSSPVL